MAHVSQYGAVRRRIQKVLDKHPELWRDGHLIEQDMTIGLPEAVWALINEMAKQTHQKPNEVISYLTQECISIIINKMNQAHN
jgi:hypothetical protein